MAHVVEHWFKQVPIVTRCYLSATVLTTIVCYLEGMVAARAYYFLEETYPRMTGRRPLRTPFIQSLFAHDEVMVPPPANVRLARELTRNDWIQL